MALELAAKWYIEPDGSKVYVHHITGAYDANNLGGFGTPNPDLNTFAIAFYPRHYTTNQNTGVSNYIYKDGVIGLDYNSLNANNHETVFEFPTTKDGVYDFNIVLIPLTVNGDEGDIRYNDSLEIIEEVVNGVYEELTDYSKLLNETKLLQIDCSEIIMNRAWDCTFNHYKLFLDFSQTEGTECKEAQYYWKKWLYMQPQLWSAFNNHRKNNKLEAQKILEGLDNICNNM